MSYLSFDDESVLVNGKSTYRSDVKSYYRDIQPTIPGTYGSTNTQIIFRLPNDANTFINLANLRFDFTAAASVTGSATGPYTICFPNGISQIVNRISLRVNGTVLVDDLQNNLVSHVYNDLLLPQTEAASGVMYLSRGVASKSTRDTWSSGREYRIPLGFKKSFLYNNSLLPCYPNIYYDIIVYLESNCTQLLEAVCTNGSLTSYSYTVSNPTLACEFMYGQSLTSKFIGKPVSIPFIDYNYFTQQISTSTSTWNLAVANRSIKSILLLLRDSQTYNSITSTGKMDTFAMTTQSAQLQSLQFFINSNPIPSQAITVSGANTRLLWEMFKSLKIDETNSPAWLDSSYTTSKFVILYEFESLRDYISGINASNTTIPLQIQTVFSQAPTYPIQADVYILYDAVMSISPQGASVSK